MRATTRLGAALAALVLSASSAGAEPAGLAAARESAARLEAAANAPAEAAYRAGLAGQTALMGESATGAIGAVFAPSAQAKAAPAVLKPAAKHPLSAPVPSGALASYGSGVSDQLEDPDVFKETLSWGAGGLLVGMAIGYLAGNVPGALAGAAIGAAGGLVVGFLIAVGRSYVKRRLSRG